jgi:hypothetical protein
VLPTVGVLGDKGSASFKFATDALRASELATASLVKDSRLKQKDSLFKNKPLEQRAYFRCLSPLSMMRVSKIL